MPTIDIHHDCAAEPQAIWELIADFADIEAWWPSDGAVRIERVVVEGEGIGTTRHIYNAGMPAPVSERLDLLDRESLTWRLSIVGERPAGIRRYHARGRLSPLPGRACRISYLGEFEAEPGREAEAREFLLGAYQLMFNGLEQAASRGKHSAAQLQQPASRD